MTSKPFLVLLVIVLVFVMASACGAPDPDSGPDGDADVERNGDADGDGEAPLEPERYCPGSSSCPDEGEGVLEVGVAKVDVTPEIDGSTETQTLDVNGDGRYDLEEGDQFDDVNGNGKFDGIWIGGEGTGRAAAGVNDPQWARALALNFNQTTIVLVSVDSHGLFHEDVEKIRESLSDRDIDYVSICATHSHSTQDTMGNWGLDMSETGVDLNSMERLRDAVVEATKAALDGLREASLEYSAFRLRDLPGDMLRYASDTRDPKIIDDEVRLLRFVDGSDADETIATIINLSTSPSYSGAGNQMLTSDIAHYIREAIEDGALGPEGELVEGVGGVALHFTGAIGAQIHSEQVRAEAWDGTSIGSEGSLELARVVGSQLGYHALRTLKGAEVVLQDGDDPDFALGFRSMTFLMPLENVLMQYGFLGGLFPTREAYEWDPTQPISNDNKLHLRTEVAVVDIGLATILMVPGQLDPALFVGGYDGSYTPAGEVIVNMDWTNPPDLDRAPGPPYLRDLAREDAEYVLLFGLANDETGYLIPEFDWVLHPSFPYIDEAEGNHYEETGAVGPLSGPEVERRLRALLEWRPH